MRDKSTVPGAHDLCTDVGVHDLRARLSLPERPSFSLCSSWASSLSRDVLNESDKDVKDNSHFLVGEKKAGRPVFPSLVLPLQGSIFS